MSKRTTDYHETLAPRHFDCQAAVYVVEIVLDVVRVSESESLRSFALEALQGRANSHKQSHGSKAVAKYPPNPSDGTLNPGR